MADEPRIGSAKFQQIIRLDALRAAGVELVPREFLSKTQAESDSVHIRSMVAAPPDAVPVSASNPVDLQPVERVLALEVLAAEVASCQRCPELFSSRTQTVFGVGPIGAAICLIGEAPGADEDRTGEPFVGAAGQLLNKILNASGLARDDVYIMNILKCRPPGNRTPKAEECLNCRSFFDRQLRLIDPKIIVCLGATAAHNLLEVKTPIGKLRGQLYYLGTIPIVCTYHPSYLLRLSGPEERTAKWQCWDDMKLMLHTIGREMPKRTDKSA